MASLLALFALLLAVLFDKRMKARDKEVVTFSKSPNYTTNEQLRSDFQPITTSSKIKQMVSDTKFEDLYQEYELEIKKEKFTQWIENNKAFVELQNRLRTSREKNARMKSVQISNVSSFTGIYVVPSRDKHLVNTPMTITG